VGYSSERVSRGVAENGGNKGEKKGESMIDESEFTLGKTTGRGKRTAKPKPLEGLSEESKRIGEESREARVVNPES